MYPVLDYAVYKYVAGASVTFIHLLFSYLKYKLYHTDGWQIFFCCGQSYAEKTNRKK
jgi:hypothetical protein